jgi:hypothetical protein
MKFTRSKTLIIIFFLGLVIVYVFLLASYMYQVKMQNVLRQQIEVSERNLSLLPAVPADLPERLETAQTNYNTVLAAVSEKNIDPTQTLEKLMKTADIFELKVNPAMTDQWMERTYSSSVYRILPFTLKITGKPEQIINYVERLEDYTQFPGLSIEGLIITGTSTDTTEPGDIVHEATINADIVIKRSEGE